VRGRRAATGQGAAFVAEALRWTNEALATTEARSGAAHILVADDNADLRDYVRRLLEAEGHVVTTAPDGEIALAELRRSPPDLAIVDVMMPHRDGFALLAAIRADARLREMPVVILSARAGEEARADGIDAGADDYLVKPFAARELVARVRTQLGHVRARRDRDRERAHLFDLVAQTPAVLAATRGPEHRLMLSNARHRALLGHADALGKPLREALGDVPGGESIWNATERAYRSCETVFVHALPTQDADGIERSFDWYATPIRDGDGVLVFGYDVTALVAAQRRAEAAEATAAAASRAKDEFLAMLGHERRNPLAPILTATQLLRMRYPDAAPREITIIERQVTHLIRLVDDLLDVARITRGTVDLRRRRLDLVEAVAQAIESASPLIDERRHELVLDVPRGIAIDADEGRVRQIVANLVTNAAKYSEPGGKISISGRSTDDGFAELTVRDSGIGIDPEMLPHIFDLFVQGGRQALDRAQGGLGIGLALVRRLVMLHGGSVEAFSDGRGTGSRFVVRLPLAGREAVTADTPSEGMPRIAGRPMRLLVVDDNRDAAQILGEVLGTLGHEVTVTYDAMGALEAVQANEGAIEVALVDIGLPVIDGYALARRLRALASPPRVIALTGYGQDVDRRRTAAAGFEAHFVKPIDAIALDADLRRPADRAVEARG
jgi:signal transduction histidine kinase